MKKSYPVADDGSKDTRGLDEERNGTPKVQQKLEDLALLDLGEFCLVFLFKFFLSSQKKRNAFIPLKPYVSRRLFASAVVRPALRSVCMRASSSSLNFSASSLTAKKKDSTKEKKKKSAASSFKCHVPFDAAACSSAVTSWVSSLRTREKDTRGKKYPLAWRPRSSPRLSRST